MMRQLFSLILALSLLCTVCIPVMAAVEDTGFSDVASDAWYADAVTYMRDSGLMSGTAGATFSPDTPTNRAMLVTLLYRWAGSPATGQENFPDVADNAWYRSAAGWAGTNGIVSGYGDGRFGPNDPVTREQLATILWRAAGRPTADGTADFADTAAIAPFAMSAVVWAYTHGIVSGKSGNRFEPQDSATRAELAVMLYRWLGPNAPASPPPSPAQTPPPEQDENTTMPKLNIQIGSRSFVVTLEDNDTTRELVARLPMTISMGELNGNEKYYYLPSPLPTNSQRPGTLHSGDLMLYGSDCLVLFYETFSSSYSYTRLGSVDHPSELAAALGRGSVDVMFRVN